MGVRIPCGFVTGSWKPDWDNRDRPYPLTPTPSLDDLVKLIEEVASEPEKAPDVAEEQRGGDDSSP